MVRQATIGKLSEAKVRNAKGKEKPYKLADGGGLYLLVNQNNAKYWRLKLPTSWKRENSGFGSIYGRCSSRCQICHDTIEAGD